MGRINIKSTKMENESKLPIYEYVGTPQKFVEWIRTNIHEISKKCGWGKVTGIYQKDLELKGQENLVIVHTVVHEDDVETHLMCEVCTPENDGLPFSAVLESFTAMGAIQKFNRRDGRIVIVSPSISERMVNEVHARNIPVNFLMIDSEHCVYWSMKK
ncbi:hypothetical protein D0T50_03570 [Bacteroides sp. 214]|uniref:hypothetical protein n=1 Tax=Bacteroides sp. 214 TaxID=2302935 RepID=UPI0013D8A66D|nr:hypothetical protein [Bacteroides sp. 214]NDW11968.1 hypothetical protein [Bacteroides sp. 214]